MAARLWFFRRFCRNMHGLLGRFRDKRLFLYRRRRFYRFPAILALHDSTNRRRRSKHWRGWIPKHLQHFQMYLDAWQPGQAEAVIRQRRGRCHQRHA
jgi:hypothetical protein